MCKFRFFLPVVVIMWIVLCVCRVRAQEQNDEGVRPDQMADLVIQALTPSPRYLVPGEQVDIEVAVRNRAIHLEPNVTVALFADHEQVVSKQIALAPGGTVTVQLPWVSAEQGLHTLTAVVDPSQALTELARQDNQTSVDVVILPQSPDGTDFAVTELQLVPGGRDDGSDDAAGASAKLTMLRATVRNHGTVTTSAPLVLRVNNQVLAVLLIERLEPGMSATGEVPVPAQSLVAVFSAEINPRDRFNEMTPTDNIITLDLRPSGVDLLIEGFSVSVTQYSQNTVQVTISFRVANIGTHAINSPFSTSVFPGSFTTLGVRSLYVTTPGLPAGKTVSISHTVVMPLGVFDVRVEADADHIIVEDNKQNNIATYHLGTPTPNPEQWVSIGPTVLSEGSVGVLTTIAIDPTSPSTIYVASPRSGVWKTTTGGASWQPITDSLGTLQIVAMAVAPSSSARVYIATSDRGVFRSDDAGTSWIQVSESVPQNIDWWGRVLLVHPNDADVLYLTTAAGVYRSDSAGKMWTLTKSGGVATDLVMDPRDPKTLYAAIQGKGIYKTTTGGEAGDNSWRRLEMGYPLGINVIKLAMVSLLPDNLYALFPTKDGTSLYYTPNGGNAPDDWTLQAQAIEVHGCSGFSTYYEVFGVDPGDPRYVYLGGVGFYRSEDGGRTFLNPCGPHDDHHAIVIDPRSPGIVYSANDGGIAQSMDYGSHWHRIGEGISNVEFYDHAVAVTDPDFIIGGTQDNGTVRFNGSTVWTQLVGNDGATVTIDPTNADILTHVDQFPNSLEISQDGGATWNSISTDLAPDADKKECRGFHYQMHPRFPTIMLASCHSLWECSVCRPHQAAWVSILPTPDNDPPIDGEIVRSAVDPTAEIYYAATSQGRLYAGFGATWHLVFTHPNAWGITDIEVDPDHPRTVYVTFRGVGSCPEGGGCKVYRLQRDDARPPSLTHKDDITFDLPQQFNVTTLAIDKKTPGTIYVGTAESGVYRGVTPDAGATWAWLAHNFGLPGAVNVTDLEVHPTTGTLSMATFGRGVYRLSP